MAATAPNAPVEIVFCFDTTGSMRGVIAAVKLRVTELIERLLADIPAIRIGILAHGDYGDEPYLLQQLDFTTDGDQLRQFISNVRNTKGFDGAECYELALHQVRTSFSWNPDTRKRLVIIGDNQPHDLNSARNKRKIDWRKETQLLQEELHMVIYSVQAYPCDTYQWFWKSLADMTGGKHLQLSDFASIFDFLMAICYLEHGVEYFEAFEQEVRSRNAGAPSADVSRMLNHLGTSSDAAAATSAAAAADTDTEDAEEEATTTPRAARRSSSARLRGTKHAQPLKAKRGTKGGAQKRIRRAMARSSRPKRETEPFCDAAIPVHGRWSTWRVLASPETPKDTESWRPLGDGFVRSHIAVPAVTTRGPKYRILVELAVSPDDIGTSVTPLFSRILCDTAKNAADSVLRGNTVLKWRLHRAITQGHRVLLRMAKIDGEGRSLRQQRHQLRKSNSYAWNSGRVVTGSGARDLLSMPAPRARLLAKFVRTMAQERRATA